MNSKSRDKTKARDHHSSNVQLTYNEKEKVRKHDR